MSFEKKFLNTIKKYNLINEKDKIICGVSGGPDSICMLDNLIKLKDVLNFEIIVCHINHCIREEAIDDENFVKEFCNRYNIKFYVKRVDVKKCAIDNKQGTEEAGRKVRYEFFDEILKKENANKIAIAHNKNDKIETIIMNTLRGTGVLGLKGIEPIRDNKYIRPLIEIQRCEIEEYCKQNNLNPKIDKTNFINDCTRNKIRNIVIPYLKKEFNPNIIETIGRLSNLITEEDSYLQRKTLEIYNEIKLEETVGNIIIDLKKFNKQELIIRKRIILYAIQKAVGDVQNIEKVNIDDIIKLCEKNVGNKFLEPNKKTKIFVNKGKVYFKKIYVTG